MNVQSFEKTDRKILGIALVVLLLSTLLLWQDAWIYRIIQSRHFKAEKIGEVTVLKNDVRRRFEVALSWLPLSNKNDVYQGDSVFTGDNSNVEITTISGEVITIAANSLVVINRKKDSISLDIGFGSVEGQVGNGKKLFITSNNNLAELSGNNGSVKIDAGDGSQLLLNVLAGEVRVRTDSGDKIMRGSDSGEILRNGGFDDASKPNIELIGPSAEQKFKLDEEKPVVFNWKTKRKYSRMKIKVSTDPNFTNSIIDTRIDDNSFSAYNLPKDTELYWQVLAEGGISTVQKFAIVGDRPPIPVLPKPGHHFFYDQQISPGLAGTSVELSWEPGSPATHYEVQLANNQIFTKNLVVKKIRSTKMKYELLQDGEYYWRVRSIDFPNMS
ncbi:MAG: hypothetical protein KDD38_11540, partial [Bdellovibrionales bacterium]|nr:hypothetical protein [Bdellovibrionales bacterium]